MAISRFLFIKLLELVIAIACIGLHSKSITCDFKSDGFAVTAFGGYIIILIGGAAGHFMLTPINRRIDIFFCLVGCVTFVTAGALNIELFQNTFRSQFRDFGLAKSALAIINGVILLIDSLLTWRANY